MKRRMKIWKLARESWIEAKGDSVEAEKIARSKVASEFGAIGALTIAFLVLRVVMALFQLWIAFQIDVPAEDPGESELEVLNGIEDSSED